MTIGKIEDGIENIARLKQIADLQEIAVPVGHPSSQETAVEKYQRMHLMESQLINLGYGPVAGVDEAGRGACAGPLVAAACILPQSLPEVLWILDDSKKLSPRQRAKLFDPLCHVALAWSIATIPAVEVDDSGVQIANLKAMRQAVQALSIPPGYVVTDGFAVPGLLAPNQAVVKGDTKVSCIAAASILAKVTRDRMMEDMDNTFPGYGFATHKGYGTRTHMEALARLGPTAHHRFSYANVQRSLVARQANQLEDQSSQTHATQEGTITEPNTIESSILATQQRKIHGY